jgi:hypothetical protein
MTGPIARSTDDAIAMKSQLGLRGLAISGSRGSIPQFMRAPAAAALAAALQHFRIKTGFYL